MTRIVELWENAAGDDLRLILYEHGKIPLVFEAGGCLRERGRGVPAMYALLRGKQSTQDNGQGTLAQTQSGSWQLVAWLDPNLPVACPHMRPQLCIRYDILGRAAQEYLFGEVFQK